MERARARTAATVPFRVKVSALGSYVVNHGVAPKSASGGIFPPASHERMLPASIRPWPVNMS